MHGIVGQASIAIIALEHIYTYIICGETFPIMLILCSMILVSYL